MTLSTIDDMQSRITEIQQRLGLVQTTGSNASSTGSTSFADTLNSLINGMGSDGQVDPSELAQIFGEDDPSSSSVTGGDVVADATKYLGIPYKWGGTDPSTGLDCSGLVQRVYGDMGISLPRVAADQAKQGTAVASLAQAQPGDLVAFGSPVDHIGIYAGNNKIIVAPKTGDKVKVESVYTTPTAIRRILPSTTNGSSTSSVSSASLSSLAQTLANGTTTTGSAGFGNLSSQYNSLFTSAGAKYGISPKLLAAVAKQESGFNATAHSGAGAMGLMQLMPSTAKSLGVNALDPAQAVDGAARMLSGLQKQFGSTSLALAAYNAGPGAVQQYGGIPPYKETQNYVKNILAMTGVSS
jgi:peptidoglycan DL-endopeptidase CwlO